MKKTLSLILFLALLLSTGGCAAEQPRDPGNFYYRRVETAFEGTDGVIAPEQRELQGIREDLDTLLQTYFDGPTGEELESPFPRDTALLSWSMTGTTLNLNLSQTFAELSGVDLTIACACICRTFTELTGAETILIQADGAPLGGGTSIKISGDMLSMADDSIDRLLTELTLYYPDTDRRYLIGYGISINLAAQDNVIAYLVEQLMEAPSGLGLVSPLPPGTRLLSATVTDGLCALDFSSEFESHGFFQSYAQRTTLLSLVNTLTQLEGIDRVEFYLEGSLMARYRQLNISTALVFDESVIGPVRTGVNEFDATLYLSNGSELYLASVPTRIRGTAGISQAELVVEQLISYQTANGFYSTIPDDTVLNKLTIEDGLCSIDLSGEFLEDGDHLMLSVRSIIASVCALEGIDTAQITIDGVIPVGDYTEYFLPQSPGSDWYL